MTYATAHATHSQVYVRDEIFGPLEMPDCYIGMDHSTYAKYNADGLFCVAMGKAARRPPQGRLPTRAARGMEE